MFSKLLAEPKFESGTDPSGLIPVGKGSENEGREIEGELVSFELSAERRTALVDAGETGVTDTSTVLVLALV